MGPVGPPGAKMGSTRGIRLGRASRPRCRLLEEQWGRRQEKLGGSLPGHQEYQDKQFRDYFGRKWQCGWSSLLSRG